MRITLKILAWLFLIIGVALLMLPLGALFSVIFGNADWLHLVFIGPFIVFALGALFFSIGYLRTSRKSYAEGISILTGFMVFGLFAGEMEKYFDATPDAAFPSGLITIVAPIALGCMVTKLLKCGIRRTHVEDENRAGEPLPYASSKS